MTVPKPTCAMLECCLIFSPCSNASKNRVMNFTNSHICYYNAHDIINQINNWNHLIYIFYKLLTINENETKLVQKKKKKNIEKE